MKILNFALPPVFQLLKIALDFLQFLSFTILFVSIFNF